METKLLLKSLKRLVPVAWRTPLRRYLDLVRHFGLAHECNICGARLAKFLAHGVHLPPDYQVEENFLCPLCRSKPPHRLASFYFDRHPEAFIPETILVHVAPETGLGSRLARLSAARGMHYRSGDVRDVGESHLDILALPFPDDSVHIFYCCHVLNALQDDRAAMREVHRVLSPAGLAILQVPAFFRGATTLETNSEAERIATFGDALVYRNYADADYRARLSAAGFEVASFHADEVPSALASRFQLKREFFHLCRKRVTHP